MYVYTFIIYTFTYLQCDNSCNDVLNLPPGPFWLLIGQLSHMRVRCRKCVFVWRKATFGRRTSSVFILLFIPIKSDQTARHRNVTFKRQ